MSDYRDSYNQFNLLYNQITAKYNIIILKESVSFLTSINKVNKIVNMGDPFKLNISLYSVSPTKNDATVICDKLIDILTLMLDWLNTYHDKLIAKNDFNSIASVLNKRSQTMFHKFINILYAVSFNNAHIDAYCRKTFDNEKTINYYAYGAKLVLRILTNVPAINKYNSTLVGNIIKTSLHEVDNIYGYLYTKQLPVSIDRLKTIITSCSELLSAPLFALKSDSVNFNNLKFAMEIYYQYTDAVYTTNSINKIHLSEYIYKLIDEINKNKILLKSNKISESNLEIVIALTAFIKFILEIMVRRNMIIDDFRKMVNYIK